jgi:hypothetical protein
MPFGERLEKPVLVQVGEVSNMALKHISKAESEKQTSSYSLLRERDGRAVHERHHNYVCRESERYVTRVLCHRSAWTARCLLGRPDGTSGPFHR